MKDRLLGMSLSYNRVRDSLIDPLVREEVFFQGDPAFGRYVADGDMPFQIVSVDGFEAVRNVVENTSPYRIQDRELTVTLRAVGDGDPEAVFVILQSPFAEVLSVYLLNYIAYPEA